MERDDLRTIRRVELLARLEFLDRLIREQAKRLAVVRQRGWDTSLYEQRAELLREARRQYLLLIKQSIWNDSLSDDAETPR